MMDLPTRTAFVLKHTNIHTGTLPKTSKCQKTRLCQFKWHGNTLQNVKYNEMESIEQNHYIHKNMVVFMEEWGGAVFTCCEGALEHHLLFLPVPWAHKQWENLYIYHRPWQTHYLCWLLLASSQRPNDPLHSSPLIVTERQSRCNETLAEWSIRRFIFKGRWEPMVMRQK